MVALDPHVLIRAELRLELVDDRLDLARRRLLQQRLGEPVRIDLVSGEQARDRALRRDRVRRGRRSG
jgi:hypothetical protein